LSTASLESTYQHQGVLEGKQFEYRRSRVYLSTSRSTGGEKVRWSRVYLLTFVAVALRPRVMHKDSSQVLMI
jgi:hypothetical protein